MTQGQPTADQPQARYELIHADDRGTKIRELPSTMGFYYIPRVNVPGRAQLTLPGSFDRREFGVDHRIEFWRYSWDESQGRLAFIMLVRRKDSARGADGQRVLTISGPDPTELILRRIVAYDAWSSEALISAMASDDALKRLIDENFVSATDTDRNIGDYGFGVSGNLGAGGNVTRSVGWENVLTSARDVASAGGSEATRTLFHVVPVTPTNWQFITWIGQRYDRGWGSARPLIFSEARGNLRESGITEDYTSEVNYFYVLGPMEGSARTPTTASDDAAIGASVFNRREGIVNAKDEQSAAARVTLGEEALRKYRARKIIRGTLVSTGSARFGRDWGLADRVAVEVAGQQENVLIESVHVQMTNDGEQIESRFEVSLG